MTKRPSRAQPADPDRPSVYDKASRWRRREELGDARYCFVIYRQPADFNGYVIRAFTCAPEGLTPLGYVEAGTLEECRAFVPREAFRVLHRAPDDVRPILETWYS